MGWKNKRKSKVAKPKKTWRKTESGKSMEETDAALEKE